MSLRGFLFLNYLHERAKNNRFRVSKSVDFSRGPNRSPNKRLTHWFASYFILTQKALESNFAPCKYDVMERTTCTLIYYLRKTRIDKEGKEPYVVKIRSILCIFSPFWRIVYGRKTTSSSVHVSNIKKFFSWQITPFLDFLQDVSYFCKRERYEEIQRL